jgi:hypothetical protein
VDPVNVVDMEPGMQEVMMGKLPDDVRTPDVTGLVGIWMDRTMNDIPSTGSVNNAEFGARLGRGHMTNGISITAQNNAVGVANFDRRLRMTQMAPASSYTAEMFTHTLLYPRR